jgi:hypothetical protein
MSLGLSLKAEEGPRTSRRKAWIRDSIFESFNCSANPLDSLFD